MDLTITTKRARELMYERNAKVQSKWTFTRPTVFKLYLQEFTTLKLKNGEVVRKVDANGNCRIKLDGEITKSGETENWEFKL